MNNQWTKVQQNLSLIAATKLGDEWLSEDMVKLTLMKEAGKSITEIAETLNRSYYAVATRLQTIGLSTPRQSKPAAKVELPPACGRCFTIHRGEC
jgi:predicted transcriptional regulator